MITFLLKANKEEGAAETSYLEQIILHSRNNKQIQQLSDPGTEIDPAYSQARLKRLNQPCADRFSPLKPGCEIKRHREGGERNQNGGRMHKLNGLLPLKLRDHCVSGNWDPMLVFGLGEH